MLQQTQVTTVIPYFERFIKTFPNVKTLAKADEDKILHLWTGLGYYSRARNLHRAAKMIVNDFNGKFPDNLIELEKLPGIGRSTAGAILSIAFQQAATILDGNVKRVLTRFQGIKQWPGDKKVLDKLWEIAETYSPAKRTDDYSQAMMDLGATLCTRGKPDCERCPLAKHCIARAKGIENKLPVSKPKKALPIRQTTLLLIQNQQRILLEKRPATGIWGGLWSLPAITEHASLEDIKDFCRKHFRVKHIQLNAIFRHTFSHFHLDILPVTVKVEAIKTKVMDSAQQIWYNLENSQQVGLPAPVKKLLRNIVTYDTSD